MDEERDLIRIHDSAGRLTRLNVFNQDRPIDDDQLDDELYAVCKKVWGYTPDDVDESLLSAADTEWFEQLDDFDAADFAEEHGYDLYIEDTDRILHDWGTFAFMILAEARGLLTPENKAAYALKREAEQFIDNKSRGVLNGR
jgi:hypothetical protein